MLSLLKKTSEPSSDYQLEMDVLRSAAQEALQSMHSFASAWKFASYLDMVFEDKSERESKLYSQVFSSAAAYVESNLRNGDAVTQLAEHSWTVADMHEAELALEELDINLNHSATQFEAVVVLGRIALNDCLINTEQLEEAA